jgi:hypothetical protein
MDLYYLFIIISSLNRRGFKKSFNELKLNVLNVNGGDRQR